METVYDFTLPRGYLDSAGELHRKGKMRLATAGDEISATRDPRVLSNPSYLTIVVLGKVVTQLEGVEMVTANLIEKLFTADLAFLQDMYQRINDIEPPMMETVCPDCGKVYKVPLNFTTGGMKLYPEEELYREMAFISYYFHWSSEEVMALDHMARRRWCSEISTINKSLSPEKKSKEKSILDMKPTR